MASVTADDHLAVADAALAGGLWSDAREAYDAVLGQAECAEARLGLAQALWWLGENRDSVAHCTRAYALFRRDGDVPHAVQSAVWLSITYKANFANDVAANGWLRRADRLLEDTEPGVLHAWTWVARAYRMVDLSTAEALTARALDVARTTGDVDLELTALAQLGLISVGQGADAAGFDMIDEAVVAALAGEQTTLATVVYACCDMLNACELAHDVERAAQWCRAADDFVSRYGCPFLYAECRIYYGSVLTATGRWEDAERELASGLALTEQTCPGLHGRALSRMAALRLRQGRLEDAADLLARCSHDLEADAEAQLSSAALALARGDAARASSMLERRIARLDHHRTQLAFALDLLVDAHIATGNASAATAAANQLSVAVDGSSSPQHRAVALGAAGRAAAGSRRRPGGRRPAGRGAVHVDRARSPLRGSAHAALSRRRVRDHSA